MLTLSEKNKIVGNIRIAFQTPIEVKWDTEKDDVTEICPYTFEDALVMTNLALFQQDKLGKKGAITTMANLCKKSKSPNELQTKIFEKLEHKGDSKKLTLLTVCFILINLTVWKHLSIYKRDLFG